MVNDKRLQQQDHVITNGVYLRESAHEAQLLVNEEEKNRRIR